MTTKLTKTTSSATQAAPLDIVTPLSSRTLFWRPHFLRDDPILNQLPFLFWLIETCRPRSFATLGGPQGVGYFAGCQALDKLDCDALCHHFGLWKDGTVPKPLKAHNTTCFADSSQQHTGRADVARMDASSLDLLLIDVTTQPEAQDLNALVELWLPTLSDQGIVLIHSASGKTQQLKDLRQRFPHFLLEAGDGLLVLLTGQTQTSRMQMLTELSLGRSGYSDVQKLFHRLGRSLALEAKVQVLEKVQQDLKTSRSQLEETRTAETASTRKAASLQSELFDAQQQLQQLQDNHSDTTAALTEATQQRTALQQDLESALTLQKELEAQLQHLEGVQATLQEQRQAGEIALRAAEAQQANTETAVAAEKATARTLQDKLAQTTKALAAEKTARQEADTALQQQKTAAQKAQAKAEAAEQKAKAQIDALQTQLDEERQGAKAAAQSAQVALKEQQAQQNQSQKKLTQTLKELNQLQNDLAAERTAHQTKMAQAQAKAQAHVADLQHQLDVQKKDNGRQAQMLNALKVEANRIQADHQTAWQKMEQAHEDRFQELALLTQTLEQQREHSAQAQEQCRALQATVKKHTTQLKKQQGQIKTQTAQLQERAQQFDANQQHIAELEQHAQALSVALQDRDTQLTGHQQHISELEAYGRDLAQQLNALRNSTSWKLTKPARKLASSARSKDGS